MHQSVEVSIGTRKNYRRLYRLGYLPERIEGHLASQRLLKLKACIANTELIVVKGLFNWLRKRKHINYANLATEVESIKVREQKRLFLSRDQIQLLMDDMCSFSSRLRLVPTLLLRFFTFSKGVFRNHSESVELIR